MESCPIRLYVVSGFDCLRGAFLLSSGVPTCALFDRYASMNDKPFGADYFRHLLPFHALLVGCEIPGLTDTVCGDGFTCTAGTEGYTCET